MCVRFTLDAAPDALMTNRSWYDFNVVLLPNHTHTPRGALRTLAVESAGPIAFPGSTNTRRRYTSLPLKGSISFGLTFDISAIASARRDIIALVFLPLILHSLRLRHFRCRSAQKFAHNWRQSIIISFPRAFRSLQSAVHNTHGARLSTNSVTDTHCSPATNM